MYIIKSKETRKQIGGEFNTHKSALWHMLNHPDWTAKGKFSDHECRKLYYIDKVARHMDQIFDCERCGNGVAQFTGGDKKTILCQICGKYKAEVNGNV